MTPGGYVYAPCLTPGQLAELPRYLSLALLGKYPEILLLRLRYAVFRPAGEA